MMDLNLLASVFAWVGVGLMVGVTGAGSAMGLGACGSAAIGAIKKRPEVFGSVLILSALPATQGLYGFVAFIMYSGVISEGVTLFQGSIILGAGIAMSIACYISALHQAKLVANGIAAVGSGSNVFGNTMILAAFPEFYAILSLVAAILMMPA
ncbi:MAG: hypothetical protein LBU70_00205 [Chitinispirillales bacterium]|jgi:V/A-type H+-transporting ATPase subunit K|nr:hypothetical protein [Chitinispirillales bacterium]